MHKRVFTSVIAGAVPFIISAIFLSGGQSGAGILCLLIGIAAAVIAPCSRHNRQRMAFAGATLVWMGLIFYLSSLTQADTPKVPLLGNWQSLVGHLALYGVCASLIEASIWVWASKFRLRWALTAAATAASYGVSDEYHQSFVAGRHGTVEDVLVNAVAAVAAAVVLWFFGRRWELRTKNTTIFHPGVVALPINSTCGRKSGAM